ncbi:hypothetical protein LPY66_03310 [Dehalobacter sp. DCM]|uniref:hypothetical protein n=1 Tax=Dehalobacter sp. DCM TaxID=2907827 RepID=UPI0030813902|nr:hypothetical protein LPY66_03310 [Dehalobacter sp. DCM]
MHDPFEVMQAGFYSLDECRDFSIAPLSLELIARAVDPASNRRFRHGLVRKEEIALLGTLSELFMCAE